MRIRRDLAQVEVAQDSANAPPNRWLHHHERWKKVKSGNDRPNARSGLPSANQWGARDGRRVVVRRGSNRRAVGTAIATNNDSMPGIPMELPEATLNLKNADPEHGPLRRRCLHPEP